MTFLGRVKDAETVLRWPFLLWLRNFIIGVPMADEELSEESCTLASGSLGDVLIGVEAVEDCGESSIEEVLVVHSSTFSLLLSKPDVEDEELFSSDSILETKEIVNETRRKLKPFLLHS